MSVTPRVPSKKSIRKVDKSLAIYREYEDIHNLDVQDREEAMDYLNDWAVHVEDDLNQHLHSPHVMMSWIKCMSNFSV